MSIDGVELLGTLLGCILYGFSLLMFGATVWVLFSRRSTQGVNRAMLTIVCLLLVLSTLYLAVNGIRIVQALILYRNTYPGGPVAFLSDVSQWTFWIKNFIFALHTSVGDVVVLYRCYVVWQSKTIMILPFVLWCGSIVSGTVSGLSGAWNTELNQNYNQWITAFFATASTSNLFTTVLVASRIWYVGRMVTRLLEYHEQTSFLQRVLRIIVDASVLYNLFLVAMWICFELELEAQFLIMDMIVPIISIVFCMVIIRVGLLAHADEILPVHLGSASTNPPSENRMQFHVPMVTDNDRASSPSPITTVNEDL